MPKRFPAGLEDETAAGYVRRIREQEQCAGVTAHLRYNLQGDNPDLLGPAEEFAESVFEKTVFPGSWTLDCYLGQYTTTPFGVHQDHIEDQFYVSPLAPKTIFAWSPSACESVDQPARFKRDFRSHPARPVALEIGIRDVAYWPRDRYHIGESPEVALSVQFNMRPRSLVLTDLNASFPRIETLAMQARGYRDVKSSQLGDGDVLCKEAVAQISECARLLQGADGVAMMEDALLKLQSAHFITNAFDEVTEPFAVPVSQGAEGAVRFRSHNRRQLLWLIRGGTLVIACNARVLRYQCGEYLAPLLADVLAAISRNREFSAQEIAGQSELKSPDLVK